MGETLLLAAVIYQKAGADILRLVLLGSRSELGF